MDHFNYKNNILHAEDVPIPAIAAAVGTPFYCYSSATLTRHFNVFQEAFGETEVMVCYALKANSNIAVIKTLAQLGAGGDAVSEGEIRRCLAAGIPANKIIFSGVGKTKAEMAYALEQDILQFNVESEPELSALNEVALSKNTKARIALRVNPDVDAKTHDKIATGRKADKFGIAYDEARRIYQIAAELPAIEVQAVACHIGSQLTDLTPFREAFTKIKDLVLQLRQDGHQITHLDLGGGLGIPYENDTTPTPEAYAKMVLEVCGDLGCTLAFEPGRMIAGNAGILVSEVQYVKETSAKNFVVIDAAMNDLMRPTLYDAVHEIIPVTHTENKGLISADIVGPICETGDVLGKNRVITKPEIGDLVAIRSAGAYGFVMASEYNTRPILAEVLVQDDQFHVIRARESYEQILARDLLPPWLG